MNIPFTHEGVVDMIIRAMRVSGLLLDDTSADRMRATPIHQTEIERNTYAASLHYGQPGTGTGIFTGVGDVLILVDSDNTDTLSPYTNYFRIGKGQSTSPITEVDHELFSIGSQSAPDVNTIVATFGPTPGLHTGTNVHAAIVHFGTGDTGSGPEYLNTLYGSSQGLFLKAYSDLGLILEDDFTVSDDTFTPKFGIRNIGDSDTILHFGGSYSDDTFQIQKKSDGHFHIFRNIDPGSPSPPPFPEMNIAPSKSADYYGSISINGSHIVGEKRAPGDYNWPSFSVFSSDSGAYTTALVHSTAIASPQTGVDVFKISSNRLPGFQPYFPFKILVYDGPNNTLPNNLFWIDDQGNMALDGGVLSPAFDVAETVESDDSAKEAGSVVVLDASGKLTKTTTSGDPKVMGIISTDPAIILGKAKEYSYDSQQDLTTKVMEYGHVPYLEISGPLTLSYMWMRIDSLFWEVANYEYNEEEKKTTVYLNGIEEEDTLYLPEGVVVLADLDKRSVTHLAVSGIVPVQCSVAGDDIAIGDLLMSYADGKAAKATTEALTQRGTVVGKAMEARTGEEGDGTINVLLTLQ